MRAHGEMLRNKANGSADCLVTETLRCLPTQTVYEVAHWFNKRFKGDCPDTMLEKGLRGFRAIALLSVLSEWHTTVLVNLLHKEKEPIAWRSLHVGVERRVNCEHMQALVTNTFQRHWEWQKGDRFATRNVQVQYGLHGKPRCQDGI